MTKKAVATKTMTEPRKRLAVWAVALGALSYQVAKGHLAFLDQPIAYWIAAWRSASLDGPMRLATFFGGSVWMLVSLLGLGLWAWRRGGATLVLIFIGAFGVGSAIEIGVKLSGLQWRPDIVTIPASMDAASRFHLTGFPSGHGFRSAFLFGWLARQLRDSDISWASVGRVVCAVMIGLVGLSRLYLNRHWASDVLGSWLVALVALSLARSWEAGWSKNSQRSSSRNSGNSGRFYFPGHP